MSALYESELNLNNAGYLPTMTEEPEAEGAEHLTGGQPSRSGLGIDRHAAHEDMTKPVHRRRRWTSEEKKAIVAETEGPGQSISGVARKYGIAPRLLFSWRRQLSEEMALTTRSGAKIVPISMVKDLEKRIHELEEALESKSLEIGALTRALEVAAVKDEQHCQ
jgi:transposase